MSQHFSETTFADVVQRIEDVDQELRGLLRSSTCPDDNQAILAAKGYLTLAKQRLRSVLQTPYIAKQLRDEA